MNSLQRALTLAFNLCLGLLPSVLFFIWLERGTTLPAFISPQVRWQTWRLIDLSQMSLVLRCGFDGLLFLSFGFLHSVFAQKSWQTRLLSWLPPQAIRTFYMTLTGVSALLVMAFWQSSGVILWALPVSRISGDGEIAWKITTAVSMILFWGFFAVGMSVFSKFGIAQFFGLKQIYQPTRKLDRVEGNSTLIQTGLYSRVRHPLYFFGALALVMTPIMTLDRLFLVAVMGLYLVFAIPFEEKKLIAIFGKQYEEYQKRVPAVIPKL
jgi:protein-S-isoprenylcysteine O-methyltransferase Ste14